MTTMHRVPAFEAVSAILPASLVQRLRRRWTRRLLHVRSHVVSLKRWLQEPTYTQSQPRVSLTSLVYCPSLNTFALDTASISLVLISAASPPTALFQSPDRGEIFRPLPGRPEGSCLQGHDLMVSVGLSRYHPYAVRGVYPADCFSINP